MPPWGLTQLTPAIWYSRNQLARGDFFQSKEGLWLLARHSGLVSKPLRASKGQHAPSVVTEYESGTGYLQQIPVLSIQRDLVMLYTLKNWAFNPKNTAVVTNLTKL